ncbi:aminotransferase class I/II-fold pyridoxal phosphate-dependent enzyme [Leeia sp. TBRC 13508]|uniref:Aminotransferase class I/II-fold pyridoxal phosphate-dependent enzyme n=1 Tax=Leeia speluncae TaxID=2884804 RepID=A0ABS8D7X7_9NEIS|nr:aminotransferase class I/II-fold pyridoxal phosphate-dependent enzyme [Leeia speluncae]MCB6184314.1 aminotransferase class I/II-fold pyridoxal phosphate-dependent enzyme [Leeia speluncae]
MAKPISKVLVINDEKMVLRSLTNGLNSAAKHLDNPFGITFTGATTATEALDVLAEDGEIQTVLIDDNLYALARQNENRQASALELVHCIHELRPEVGIYIMIDEAQQDEVVDVLFSEAIAGYFYREERDYRGWFRILHAQIGEKARTPFYDALHSYVLMAKDAWHTPGHSSGDSLRGSPWVNDFHEFMGEHIFRADLSVSVDMLDSLLDPKGVIEDAQQLAAKAFGAKRTFFATNGTSTANKVIFQTLLTPGDKLLLDRNCHKSVHHGVVLSGAHPIYLNSSVNKTYGVFGTVPKAAIFDAIEKHPDAKVLILTSCTYDGLRYDLPPIIKAAHEKGIKVIIDEAWYGCARFHPAFRPTALEAGADYATQSTHKVLSAFSQASMIHVNDPDFNEHIFRENFNMHASTSPQYSMLASLDVGRKQATMEGFKLLNRTLELAKELRQSINSTGIFRALELEDLLPDEVKHDGVQLDPTKVTIDISGSGYTTEEFQKELFQRYNIQVEKSTFNTVTLLLTIGTTRSKVSRLYDALMRIAREKRAPRRLYRAPDIAGFTRLKFLPRDAYYAEGEMMPMIDEDDHPNQAMFGRVCADQIVPYPPGIPALVPGQEITEEILTFLLGLMKSHKRTEMHGVVFDGYVPTIRVLKSEEESIIKPLVE